MQVQRKPTKASPAEPQNPRPENVLPSKASPTGPLHFAIDAISARLQDAICDVRRAVVKSKAEAAN